MGPATPTECNGLFVERLNCGDVDALLELYEEEAGHITHDGELVRGGAALRAVLEEFAGMGVTLASEVTRVAAAGGDLAVVYERWQLRAPGGDGAAMEGAGAHLLRRQADGSWRFALTGLTNALEDPGRFRP